MILASVPAAHPYVAALVDTARVTLLPDPVPRGAIRTGQWWPPRLLEPDYLRHRLGPIDVLHVHFGFDTQPPEQLDEVLDVLNARGMPLVLTVHDLQNPHFVDQRAHAARLDVLVPAAAAVVTLTGGAAAEIERRWDRRALVVPHPHVLPIEVVGASRVRRERPIVAIHAKNLRANVDPWPLLDHLLAIGGDRRLRLDLDDDVFGAPRAAETCPTRLEGYRRAGVDVRVHPPFTDAELARYLAEVDVLVLPYRHGSHSGWVEACHDARVHAVVPDCGYYREQHQLPVFGYGTGRFDADGFASAVQAAVAASRAAPVGVDEGRRTRRAEERQRIRDAMTRLYRGVLDGCDDEVRGELSA